MSATDRDSTDWFNSELGKQVLRAEQGQILSRLETLGCRSALQLASPWGGALLVSPAGCRVSVLESTAAGLPHVAGQPDALPFGRAAFDAVVVPHTLETARNPEAILAEACRVLEPEGYLIVTGFNPASSWGVWHLAKRLQRLSDIARHRFLPLPWLRRQLQRRAVDPVGRETLLFGPPARLIYGHVWSRKFESIGAKISPGLGGVYVFVGQKKRLGMTLVGPDQRQFSGYRTRGLLPAAQRRCA
ncbi:MAG: class I SAM-dependent methyltransferase [Gammaproteobacteria bacterium]|nr:class I SAM-dependent methyltransferase [Gammaproteobacteria bacterium]